MRRAVRLITGPAGAGPAVALALIAALAAFLATAGPRESTRLQNRALTQTLAASPQFGVFASAESTVFDPRRQLTAGQLAAGERVLGNTLVPPMVSRVASRWAGIVSPQSTVLNPAPSAVLVFPPLIETDYFAPLAGNARLVSGALPRTARTIRRAGKTIVVLQAAVTPAMAARFRVHPGSVLRLSPLPGGADPEVEVTGVVQPVSPGSSFWAFDPPAAAPTITANAYVAAVLIGPGELGAFPQIYPQQQVHATWAVPLDTSGITVPQIPALVRAMTSVAAGPAGNAAQRAAHANLIAPPAVYSAGLSTLSAFGAGQAATGAIDALLADGLFAVAVILLLACALVVTGAQAAEVALIIARGGSTGHAALRVGGRSAVAAGPALAAGVLAGLAVTPGGGSPSRWLILAVAVTTIGAPPLIIAWQHRGGRPQARTGRADLVVPRASRRRLVAEAGALAVIVGAVAALRLRGAQPGPGSDPYVSSAPVLVAVAAGLVAARIYPLPLRLLLRLAAPRRSPVGFLGIARAARSRPAVLLPALALVVALAVIALGGTLRAAVSRGQVAASWQQTGADVVIGAKGAVQDIGPRAQRAIAAVPGVTHTAALYVVAPGDPQAANLLLSQAASMSAGVLIVNPDRYAALAGATPFPAFPARLLARRGIGGAVPILATPRLAAAMRKGAGRLAVASTGLAVRLAGTITSTPGMPGGGQYVVLPSWASAQLRDSTVPNVLLATGSAINIGDLKRTLARVLPFSDLLSRQAVLAAKRRLPSVQGSNTAFGMCVAAALAVSVAAVLLGLLLSGRDRTRVAAWLAALGMTGRQARRLAMLDALPLVLIAVLGAVAAGSVAAQTIAPALNLAAFTGSGTAVPVRLDLVSMTVPAVAAIILVAVITAAQNALTRRRTKTGVLRLDEGR